MTMGGDDILDPGPDENSAASSLNRAIHDQSADVLIGAASNPGLTEDLALALLKRRDLPAEAIEAVAKNSTAQKSRKVRLAIVMHPKVPRHVALPLIGHLFTLELMQAVLDPATPPDLKVAMDQTVVARAKNISSGEKITLAQRGSGRVAGALLADSELRIVQAALGNSRLVEADVVKILMRDDSSAQVVDAVCHNPKWSVRGEVRLALLRNSKTPLAKVLEIAHGLRLEELREVLQNSRLSANVRSYLTKELERRGSQGARGAARSASF